MFSQGEDERDVHSREVTGYGAAEQSDTEDPDSRKDERETETNHANIKSGMSDTNAGMIGATSAVSD